VGRTFYVIICERIEISSLLKDFSVDWVIDHFGDAKALLYIKKGVTFAISGKCDDG
jgi:hypothetical protein